MPLDEYRAWERHMARGLAPEVWTPMLLVHLIEIVNSALGGRADWRRTVPWLAPDPGPPAVQEARRMKQVASMARRHAVELAVALRRREAAG